MLKGATKMDYRATLNLPQTKFKMKANLSQKEPEFLKQWEKEDLYGQIQAETKNKPLYILHDGPPYAGAEGYYSQIKTDGRLSLPLCTRLGLPWSSHRT
jgi:hypothetical protein